MTSAPEIEPTAQAGGDGEQGEVPCWGRAGTEGDGTCPRLTELISCRNCPAHLETGRRLFERPPPSGAYLDQWAQARATPPATAEGAAAVLLVSLGEAWLALPAAAVEQVLAARPVRRLPHRADGVLLGLVNAAGTLTPCASLAALLELTAPTAGRGYLVVLALGPERWALPVDVVHGLAHLRDPTPAPTAAAAPKPTSPFVRASLTHQGHAVALLEPTAIAAHLARRIEG